MQALFFDSDAPLTSRPLHRVSLSDQGSYDEKWLQALLFDHPQTIPIDALDPGAGVVVPLCRELAIPKEGGTVFLDLLGVTGHGRLVLIECKLWRNPQARREVIAQILEYAALLSHWSYADLTARLKASFGWTGANPLFERVRDAIVGINEARFVDAVSRSLASGDFNLIVAGDGIRSDIHAIASHLNGTSGHLARLALVEFQLWTDSGGCTVVVPAVALRTEIVQHHVVLDSGDMPLRLRPIADEAEPDPPIDPDRTQQRTRNRSFWQHFLDEVRFDHPDQPPPRHGDNNWVRLDLPAPATGMTAYRNRDAVGLFVTLAGPAGAHAYETLEAEALALQAELGVAPTFKREAETPFKGTISVAEPLARFATGAEPELQAWLTAMANRMVNTFRPRLGSLGRAQATPAG